MNRRQLKKCKKNGFPIDMVKHCVNRDSCGDSCNGCHYPIDVFFRKLLKKDNLSFYAWEVLEAPARGVCDYHNRRKKKTVTIFFENKQGFIFVTDPNSCYLKEAKSLKEALSSSLQNRFYHYSYYKIPNNIRGRRRKAERYRETMRHKMAIKRRYDYEDDWFDIKKEERYYKRWRRYKKHKGAKQLKNNPRLEVWQS